MTISKQQFSWLVLKAVSYYLNLALEPKLPLVLQGSEVYVCNLASGRNRSMGEKLGTGLTVEQALDEMHMVAEGIGTSNVY